MKANIFKTVWIMFGSAILMAIICIKIVVSGLCGCLSRSKADRFVRKWSQNILSFIGLTYKVHNPHLIEFSSDKRYIVMVNHSSLYDIPITYVALPGSIRMVAKKELFRIPMFGSAMRYAEVVSIDRQNRRQAIKDLQLARERMESGLILWMAPEGTRSRTGKIGPFKKGGFILAIRSGATIVPVGIRGANDILPAKTWQFHLNKHVDVHIGQPIDASEYNLNQKEELLARVETELKQLAGQDKD